MTADYESAFRWACRAFYQDPDGTAGAAAQTVVGMLATRLRRRGWIEDRIAEAMHEELVRVTGERRVA